jgi:uncharacterized membrane protein
MSKGVKIIGLAWTAFIGENLIMSENRTAIIEFLGDEKRYRQLYSALSLAACSGIGYGYLRYARTGPVLARPGALRSMAALALQFLGAAGLSQMAPKLQVPLSLKRRYDGGDVSDDASLLSKVRVPKFEFSPACPIDWSADERVDDTLGCDGEPVRGLKRVTRHPQLWSLAALAAGCGLRTVFQPKRVFFAAPVLFASIGSAHQDARHRRGEGGLLAPEYELVTSNVPFVALANGTQDARKLCDELKWVNIAASTFLLFIVRLALKRRVV